MKWILIFSVLTLLIMSGCAELSVMKEKALSDHSKEESGPTINEFFGKDIIRYTEETVSERIECISGRCPDVESELKTVEKDCYFCDVSKIRGNELGLIHDKGMSRLMDAFFGCITNYDGPVMDGFEIIEQNDEILRVMGEIKFYYSQKSTHCDKEKDPECDDMTYGTCPEEDYSQVSIRTVEMVFKP